MDFERAYRLYSRRVYSKCLHMVGNEAEAEDLTQEVFLQLFRKWTPSAASLRLPRGCIGLRSTSS